MHSIRWTLSFEATAFAGSIQKWREWWWRSPWRRLLHVADEPDGLHGFGRVEQASLRRDDDEIGPADRVADHQGRGSLEIDDDEGGLEGGPVDLIQDRIFRHVSDDGQT